MHVQYTCVLTPYVGTADEGKKAVETSSQSVAQINKAAQDPVSLSYTGDTLCTHVHAYCCTCSSYMVYQA